MIKLKDVSVKFSANATALHPTSLHFRRGEFTVLLGASGAGKSTLLRTLNLLNPLSTGTISVDDLGEICSRKTLHRHRRATGMIFQQHQLIGRQTALTNVLLGRIGYHPTWRTLFPLSRSERKIALECLTRVGLLHKALERVDNLSGGQQQRVGIARALAQQPRLMLADEPVASLDPTTSQLVLSQLKRISAEDEITTVVSLHQVELAQTFADRIIGLANGHIVFDGSADQLDSSVLQTIYSQSHSAVTPASPISPTPAINPFNLSNIKD